MKTPDQIRERIREVKKILKKDYDKIPLHLLQEATIPMALRAELEALRWVLENEGE